VHFSRQETTYAALEEYLKEAREVAREQQKAEAERLLAEALEKLAGGSFNLVILGQFKRGKSTLINALIGAPLLPMGVIPLTSIATKICYGDELTARVRFQNGSERSISVDEVPEYVTEAQNPLNKKQVESVEISYPSPYLRHGVVLVDTPGVGSVYRHNTDVAYEWLAKADAALFLLAADPPISKEEVDFLQAVTEFAGKIFFVQNKVDRLTPAEQEESLAFCSSVLAPLFPRQKVRIYPLSAKLALEGKLEHDEEKLKKSLLPELERDLGEFLLRGKAEILALSVCKAGLRAVDELELALAVEEKALSISQAELEEKALALDRFLLEVEQEKKDMLVLLDAEVRTILTTLENDLAEAKRKLSALLISRLEERIANSSGKKLAVLEQELADEQRALIVEFMDRFRETEAGKILADFIRVQQRFSERTKQILDRVHKLVAELFAVDIKPAGIVEALAVRDDFYYKLDEEPPFFPIEPKALRRLLPAGIARRLLLDEMKNKAAQLVDRQCGRVRHDFALRLESTARTFKKNLIETIAGLTEGLKGALAAAREKRAKEGPAAEEAAQNLARQVAELRRIRDGLQRIQADISGVSLPGTEGREAL
jgi:hypothetical protein